MLYGLFLSLHFYSFAKKERVIESSKHLGEKMLIVSLKIINHFVKAGKYITSVKLTMNNE